MKMLSKFAVLAAMSASSVVAGTISYSATFGPSQTDFSHGLALNYFDQSLFPGQTLTGVVLTFNVVDDIINATVTNNGASTQTFDAAASSKVFLSGAPDALATISLNLFDSGLITLGAVGSGTCPVGTPSASCSSVSYNPPSVSGMDTVNSANINAYKNTGQFTITGTTLSGTTLSGGGNTAFVIATNATLAATVTYTYVATGAPEPATMSLFGGALLGIGFFARKRAKRS